LDFSISARRRDQSLPGKGREATYPIGMDTGR
jgi:hypothetical protein